jgi:excinuclease ABC subunit C
MAFEKARNLKRYLDDVNLIFATLEHHYSQAKYADQIVATTTPKVYFAHMPSDIDEQLQQFLRTTAPIKTIDCFDISHFQGNYIVGSCIRFMQGRPDKNKFRRFRVRMITEQNDYAALQEIVFRRYKDATELPDLILIDGGKGQLSAVQQILPHAHIISLAKKEERLFGTYAPEGIKLDLQDPVGKILIALRDYAHHFAISYHRLLRSKGFTSK